MDAEEVKRIATEAGVKFVRLQFTDILGITKNVAVPIAQLDKALAGELTFDGSSIEGFVRVQESDMRLAPDPNTFTIYPWRSREAGVARLICDIRTPDGEPFSGCTRTALRRVVEKAAEMGFVLNVGPEPEFFLFRRTPDGKPTTESQDQAGYFDLAPIDRGEDARRDIVLALTDMGIEVEASHHEVAPGQHEIDLKYADALTAADRISTFRVVVRTIALRHDLHATFMPKPLYGQNGSGMHLHLSLFRGRENAFYDPSRPNGLSEIALQFIAGLLRHARALTAITNPLVNSYKRLVPGYEAPLYATWSERMRSPMIRVPARRGLGTRIELRTPDPSCNPYLALAVCLQAGLDGIRNRLVPPAPCNRNVQRMSPAERAELGIERLPVNLREALVALEHDEVIQEALGEHIYRHFLEAKEIEWEVYESQVHPWELEQYLATF